MPQGSPLHSLPNASRLLRRALRAYAEGEFGKAERLCNAVLQHDARNFDAMHTLGQIHLRRGRLDTALALVQAALHTDLDRGDGFATLGTIFHALRRPKEALKSYQTALDLAPNDADLLNRCGVALLDLGRPQEALDYFDRLLAANPANLDALGNRGNALVMLNRQTEALGTYERALEHAPDNAQLLTNRAVVLRRLDRPREALMCASRALVSRPHFAQARFVESVARLTLGDFKQGWRGYETRWDVGFLASQRRTFTAPLWLGAPSLAGKAILLHAEQGFGDTLQFVRYAPLLAKRGAKVILELPPALSRLLCALPGIDVVLIRGDALPRFDFHCPLMSLPLAFGTELETIPAVIPYIAPAAEDVAAWRARLSARGPLIGLVWSGEPSHDNDLNRSMRLATLLPLLDLRDMTFVSLQHEVRESDAGVLREHPEILRIGDQFGDFADTAAAIAVLDVVVAVDTAVAHLAGAIGKPVFILLPFAADFRWLRERTDSPWYPTARLFRQPRFGDWTSVVDAVRAALVCGTQLPSRLARSA